MRDPADRASWACPPSAQPRRELDDVVVVVLEEAQAAVDRLEVDGVAEDLDAAGTKLGERPSTSATFRQKWWYSSTPKLSSSESIVACGSAEEPPRRDEQECARAHGLTWLAGDEPAVLAGWFERRPIGRSKCPREDSNLRPAA
jgi:hypothetical protein